MLGPAPVRLYPLNLDWSALFCIVSGHGSHHFIP